MLAEDHPGTVVKALQTLLCKMEEIAADVGFGLTRNMNLPKSLTILNAGSVYDEIVRTKSRTQYPRFKQRLP
jgi:hypothetical protein